MYLFIADIAGTFGDFHIVAADLFQRRFILLQLNDLTAGNRTVAVTVSHDHRAGLFDHFSKGRIINLAADDRNTGTVPGFRIRFTLLQLLQRLPQIRKDLLLRAGVAGKGNDMELIACNHRIVRLAHFSDFGDNAADFIVLFNGFPDSCVGYIHAIALLHHIQQANLHLLDIVAYGIILHLIRHVAVCDEEVRLLVHLQQLEMLIEAVHHGAGIHTGKAV